MDGQEFDSRGSRGVLRMIAEFGGILEEFFFANELHHLAPIFGALDGRPHKVNTGQSWFDAFVKPEAKRSIVKSVCSIWDLAQFGKSGPVWEKCTEQRHGMLRPHKVNAGQSWFDAFVKPEAKRSIVERVCSIWAEVVLDGDMSGLD